MCRIGPSAALHRASAPGRLLRAGAAAPPQAAFSRGRLGPQIPDLTRGGWWLNPDGAAGHCPVALTAAAWSRCVAVPPGVLCQDEAGRLWDVLTMLRVAAGRPGRPKKAQAAGQDVGEKLKKRQGK